MTMESYFDGRDEEREFQVQRERRQRMRRRILCVGILITLITFFGFVIKSARKSRVDETLQEEKKIRLVEQNNKPDMDEPVAETDISAIEQEEEKTVYNFQSTSDTAIIYSEEVISTHAILVNESTDTIIASKGADEKINPASMTKVLTVLVAAEKMQEENLDDTFTMTLEITDYAYVNDCSSVGFLNGEEVTVRDLFYGTVLPSGGDAAVGLATYIAGSHEAFVDMMNTKLEELGISDSAHLR